MSSGFVSKGFRTLGAVDLEVAKPSHGTGATSCNDTYERNLGLRPMSADLAVTGPAEVASHFGIRPGDVDVLISCAPCTGFSQKQSRNHVQDDGRNRLVERAAVFAEAWRPRYVVIENVKELLRGRHKHHFQGLHRGLTRLGYEVFAEIHDLKDFGLPQSRIRSLIVAKLGGPFHLDLPRVPTRTVRDAIGHLPAVAAGEPPVDLQVCAAVGHALGRLGVVAGTLERVLQDVLEVLLLQRHAARGVVGREAGGEVVKSIGIQEVVAQVLAVDLLRKLGDDAGQHLDLDGF